MHIIGGKYKRKKLYSPSTALVRPTKSKVREMIFNICQWEIEGAHFLDLCAGAGTMGLEGLSRGASHAVFIEQNREALATLKKNIISLGVEKETTLLGYPCLLALAQLHKQGRTFDIIYADPPYDRGFGREILLAIDQYALLKPTGVLFIEEGSCLAEETLHSLQLHQLRHTGKTHIHEYVCGSYPSS